MRSLLLCVLVVGCTDSASSEPVCAQAPHVSFDRGPLAIATGGNATIALHCNLSDLPGSAPWDLPSTPVLSPPGIATLENSGPDLVIHADQVGSTTLSIVSGSTTYGSLQLSVADVDHVTFRAEYESSVPPGYDLAFAKEEGTLVVASLFDATGAGLVDSNLTITPPAGGVWQPEISVGAFNIANVPVGEDVIEVAAGGKHFSSPFVVVDHADSIALVDPNVTVPATSSVNICFAALAGARFIEGLTWDFHVDGAPQIGFDCAGGQATEDLNHDGTLTVDVTAGGVSAQFDVPVM